MKSISTTLLVGLLMSLFTYFFIPTPQKAISGYCDIYMIKSYVKQALDKAISPSIKFAVPLSDYDVQRVIKRCLDDASVSGGQILARC